MSRPLTLGLLWHSFQSDNLGVGALSVANALLLREAAEEAGRTVEFVVIGPGGSLEYSSRAGAPVRNGSYSLKRPGRLIALWRSCDAIFDISGGDSFTDLYGRSRFLHQAFTKVCAVRSGRPLVLCPQTIGPFHKPVSRAVAHWVMRRSARVFTRDEESVASVPPGARVAAAMDVAFTLPYERQARPWSARPQIGLNVSGLLYSGGYSQDNMFGLKLDYKALCHDLIAWLAGEGDVHLLGHVNSADFALEDDYRVCEALHDEFPETTLAPRFTDPVTAKTYLATLDFFLGSRMHATIGAFSAGVPIVPISYSVKFARLYHALGYPHLVEGRSMGNDEAMLLVKRAFADRATLAAQLPASIAQAHERVGVYRNYLRELLGSLP